MSLTSPNKAKQQGKLSSNPKYGHLWKHGRRLVDNTYNYRVSRETITLGSVANKRRHVRGTSKFAWAAPRDDIELQLAYLGSFFGKMHPSLALALAK